MYTKIVIPFEEIKHGEKTNLVQALIIEVDGTIIDNGEERIVSVSFDSQSKKYNHILGIINRYIIK